MLTEEELKNRILELVSSYWNENSRPMLLSVLGGLDGGGGAIAQQAKAYSSSLSDFLRGKLNQSVAVVKHSSNSVIVAVMPLSETQKRSQEDIDALLNIRSTVSAPKKIRFHYGVWSAFRTPCETSKKRYLVPELAKQFSVSSDCEELPEGAILIEDKWLPQIGQILSADDIYKNIEGWASEHNIGLSDLSVSHVMEGKMVAKGKDDGDSLLSAILDALSSEELRRVSVPLDVVRKLHDSKF